MEKRSARPQNSRSHSSRWFRALLLLFPAEFRVDHRRDMEQVFRDEVREARSAGRLGLARLWLATCWGTLTTAPTEHLRIFRQDAAYALRRMLKNPGMSLVAVVTIGLGIGATTAVFSLVNQVLLRPLPYDQPERLVHLRPLLEGEESMSGPIYHDLLREITLFEGLFTMSGLGSTTISGEEGPERVKRLIVSTNYFDLLGTRPLRGRLFQAEDQVFLSPELSRVAKPEELPVGPVVISHDLWQRRYGGDAETVGELLQIGRRAYEIIGILPADFRVWAPRLMNLDARRDLWYLSDFDPALFPRDVHYLEVLAKLSPGVTLAEAQAEIDTFCARQQQRHASVRDLDYRIRLEPLHHQVVADSVKPLWLLFGAVTLVLLIACSNVASLMLAGGATRQGELGLRVALGASRERLVRLLMTESFLVSVVGAGLGLALAHYGLALLAAHRPESLQRFEEVHIDRAMLVFTLLATTFSAFLFGLVPSLRYSQPKLKSALTPGRRSLGGLLRGKSRGLLVAGEIALCFMLMAAAGLLTRTFLAHQHVDPGFAPQRVTTTYTHLPWRDYPEARDRIALLRQITEEVEAVAGVVSVGLTTSIPFDASGGHTTIGIDRDPETERLIWDTRVAPGYFRTLGIPLRSGRLPEWHDMSDPDRPFALVDEALAERLWPGENALGRQVRISRLDFGRSGDVPTEQAWAEVIGVVAAIHDDSLAQAGPETLYLGLNFALSNPVLTVKTAGEPTAAVRAEILAALRRIHPELATSPFTEMNQWIADSTANLRFTLSVLGLFGIVGLGLAAVGLYALLSYSVRRGSGEIGLRMALGAEPQAILGTVLRAGMRLTLIGLAGGVLGSLLLDRLLASLLFGVDAYDPGTLVSTALVLMATAMAACAVPAVKALCVDPLSALRTD